MMSSCTLVIWSAVVAGLYGAPGTYKLHGSEMVQMGHVV